MFVNEGKREDYQLLLKDKIDLQGKIVLVKEGKLKLSVSERISIGKQFGISGFIMYSDPLAQAQNENENNTREQNQVEASIHRDVIETLEDDEIVSIPISYKSILPILNTLGKPKRSGLFQNWTYNPTVSSTTLFLDLETSFDTNLDTRKVTNIISTMDGILQDGEVVIGCSRDSLTSTNPLSGHAIMFEIMENFQRLTKLGWKPLRPIKFVSWDGTHSGLSGSKLYLNDPHAYNSNMPVVAYINIDGDGVMGSHFQVDGHPTLNHILKKVSKYVPIPKKSIYFKTLLNDDNELMGEEDKEEEEDIDVSSSTSGTTSLYRYWKKQDNNTINPYLGDLIKLTDAINFQQHLGVPIVNAKFSNDPRRDTLIYTPNSNFYSYDWLIDRDIDNDMILHGLLVRFLGLLTISFVENEVSDRRIFPYIKQIQTFFLNVTYSGESEQKLWLHKEIPLFLINKADIYTDIEPAPLPDKKIGFVDLIVQFNILIDNLISQSKIYDEYNSQVEKNLMKDYAWYHLLMKVKHYAQFKVANYKLLRLEQELMVNRLEDFKYLYSNFTCQEPWFNHIIYGLSKFDASATNSSIYEHRDENSVFPGFQDSFREQDFDQSVRWLVISYSKLKGLYKKMT